MKKIKDMFTPKGKEQERAVDAAVTAARKCLAMEEFKKYREAVKVAIEGYHQEIIAIDVLDPVIYAVEVKRIVERIKTLKALMVDVMTDAEVPIKES